MFRDKNNATIFAYEHLDKGGACRMNDQVGFKSRETFSFIFIKIEIIYFKNYKVYINYVNFLLIILILNIYF